MRMGNFPAQVAIRVGGCLLMYADEPYWDRAETRQWKADVALFEVEMAAGDGYSLAISLPHQSSRIDVEKLQDADEREA